MTTEALSDAQARVAEALDQVAIRWRLDEAVSNAGKPSELYYLVRIRKSMSKDDLLTAVRTSAADKIMGAEVQMAKAIGGETGRS